MSLSPSSWTRLLLVIFPPCLLRFRPSLNPQPCIRISAHAIAGVLCTYSVHTHHLPWVQPLREIISNSIYGSLAGLLTFSIPMAISRYAKPLHLLLSEAHEIEGHTLFMSHFDASLLIHPLQLTVAGHLWAIIQSISDHWGLGKECTVNIHYLAPFQRYVAHRGQFAPIHLSHRQSMAITMAVIGGRGGLSDIASSGSQLKGSSLPSPCTPQFLFLSTAQLQDMSSSHIGCAFRIAQSSRQDAPCQVSQQVKILA
ncbi:hypothetical protein EJ04DRAFT_608070 [Polyplosphaeria fusca]|uniref:Uncharacterized protein n=1 Tax=Polyplosphaeria fusca TaxID=682080 RepID=A0A9P4R619_9PLEO|nr:hypothetical protein EJ04DRAFT_608070 [Polyplosphaeria fusca]